jgi:CubicO group peptidase (beta-lactamase class C family)
MKRRQRVGLSLLVSGIGTAGLMMARDRLLSAPDGPPTALTSAAVESPPHAPQAVVSPRAIGADRARLARFEQEVESLRKRLKIPGLSAVIVRDGEVLWTKGLGYADVENRTPAAPETLYHVASLTKTFASTLIMQLVEQGKLDLDEPMSRYSSDFKDDTVKVKHLLSHTSEGVPGEKYRYSGNRYNYLTAVIEKTAGKSFREVVINTFIRPLKMTGSVPGHDVLDGAGVLADEDRRTYRENLKKLAQPYRLYGGSEVVHALYPRRDMGAAAGLLSTVADMARYDAAIDNHTFITGATQDRAWTPFSASTGQTLPHGMGWFVETYRGDRLVWHYGNWGSGFSALHLKLPAHHLTLILLANSEGLSDAFYHAGTMDSPFGCTFLRLFLAEASVGQALPGPNWSADAGGFGAELVRLREKSKDYDYQREQTAFAAMSRWLDAGRRRARPAIKLDTSVLEEYVGRYELNARRTFTVRRVGNTLHIDIPKDNEAEMFAESENRFYLKVADVQAVFVKDAQGRVSGLRLTFEGQNMQAQRGG